MGLNINKIREDFDILKKKINNKPITYLDSACVSLKPRQVVEKINSYYNEFTACGGRSMHRFGNRVTDEVEKSRGVIKKFINSKKENEIIFTRNTTEGLNIVTKSLELKKGDKIIQTDKEHNSSLLPCLVLKENGVLHEIVKSNDDNTFNLENFENKMDKSVKLVSVVHTSNLDGVTNPVKEIIKIAHDHNALVLLDSAQSVPHKDIDVKNLDVDFMAFSGHKMLGSSGTGILYGKEHLLNGFKPFLIGGETVTDSTYNSYTLEKIPHRFEAGLQNYAGIMGLGEAAKYLMRIGKSNIEKHETNLNKRITEKLIDDVKIIGPEDSSLRGGVFNFNIEKTDPHELALMLDESENVMIRSGAHCVHSWYNAHNLDGSARATLYFYNTEEEVDRFVEAVKKVSKLLL